MRALVPARNEVGSAHMFTSAWWWRSVGCLAVALLASLAFGSIVNGAATSRAPCEMVTVKRLAGEVGVREPGEQGFVPLKGERQIPVGSLLDTRQGSVRLTGAAATPGSTQSGDFAAGMFQVLESRTCDANEFDGFFVLSLRGSGFANCGGSAGPTVIRRLQADAKGRFRTRGRYSAATVRGTQWDTIDRCDGTLTRVRRGTVAVRDFCRDRKVRVDAGDRYLARASDCGRG
jgi:hypothetical protein